MGLFLQELHISIQKKKPLHGACTRAQLLPHAWLCKAVASRTQGHFGGQVFGWQMAWNGWMGEATGAALACPKPWVSSIV